MTLEEKEFVKKWFDVRDSTIDCISVRPYIFLVSRVNEFICGKNDS